MGTRVKVHRSESETARSQDIIDHCVCSSNGNRKVLDHDQAICWNPIVFIMCSSPKSPTNQVYRGTWTPKHLSPTYHCLITVGWLALDDNWPVLIISVFTFVIFITNKKWKIWRIKNAPPWNKRIYVQMSKVKILMAIVTITERRAGLTFPVWPSMISVPSSPRGEIVMISMKTLWVVIIKCFNWQLWWRRWSRWWWRRCHYDFTRWPCWSPLRVKDGVECSAGPQWLPPHTTNEMRTLCAQD